MNRKYLVFLFLLVNSALCQEKLPEFYNQGYAASGGVKVETNQQENPQANLTKPENSYQQQTFSKQTRQPQQQPPSLPQFPKIKSISLIAFGDDPTHTQALEAQIKILSNLRTPKLVNVLLIGTTPAAKQFETKLISSGYATRRVHELPKFISVTRSPSWIFFFANNQAVVLDGILSAVNFIGDGATLKVQKAEQ